MMQKDLGNYRKSYEKSALLEHVISANPMALFQQWFKEAEASNEIEEPNAMTLATNGTDGFPKTRVVLLKQFNDTGFVFYTNYESEKGKAIAKNSKVCLSFFWPNLERQIIIKGEAQQIAAKESDAYFNSRPKGSRLGALVSPQSQVIASRAELEDNLKILENEYVDKQIPRPEHWGGYLVTPFSLEFWQGRPNRLHDRIRYERQDATWIMERLAP